MLAPHSTLLSGIFFNSTEQFRDVVNSREVRRAGLSPSPNDLGTREAVFLRRRTAGLRHSNRIVRRLRTGKRLSPTIPNQLRVNQCGCLAGQELAAACRSVRKSFPSQVNKSNAKKHGSPRRNSRSLNCGCPRLLRQTISPSITAS